MLVYLYQKTTWHTNKIKITISQLLVADNIIHVTPASGFGFGLDC